MKVYIAGPYTPCDGRKETLFENIAVACEAAGSVLRAGHTPLCLHTMTLGWEDAGGYDDFLRLGLEWLTACDAILLLPGWEESRGARREYDEAVTLGLLIVDAAKGGAAVEGLASQEWRST